MRVVVDVDVVCMIMIHDNNVHDVDDDDDIIIRKSKCGQPNTVLRAAAGSLE